MWAWYYTDLELCRTTGTSILANYFYEPITEIYVLIMCIYLYLLRLEKGTFDPLDLGCTCSYAIRCEYWEL